MTGHMSAFTNFNLSYFRIPLSIQIVSRSMVAFLALPILALMSSEQLPVLVLMAPRYLKAFTLSIVSPSTSIDTLACSSPTTISFVFVHSILVILSSQHHLPYVLSFFKFPVEIYHTVLCHMSLHAPHKNKRGVDIECTPVVRPPLRRKAWCVIRSNVRLPIVRLRLLHGTL